MHRGYLLNFSPLASSTRVITFLPDAQHGAMGQVKSREFALTCQGLLFTHCQGHCEQHHMHNSLKHIHRFTYGKEAQLEKTEHYYFFKHY